MNVAIYSDLDVKENILNLNHQIDYFDWQSRLEFFSQVCDLKISVIEVTYKDLKNFSLLCEQHKNSDLVLVYSMEISLQILEIMQLYDYPNFVYVINAVLNTGHTLKYAKVVPNFPWLYQIANIYNYQLKDVHRNSLTSSFDDKEYKFEVLYGSPKPSRIFTRNFLSKFDGEGSWFYQSPFFIPGGDQTNLKYNQSQSSDWFEDEMVLSSDGENCCKFHGIEMYSMGFVMPYKIFNKTLYSLVCETYDSNKFSFFTEKVARSIIANRLFIVISGQHYLKNLRSIGFKTFDNVIDESYDDVEDNETRWSMALEQATWLCTQNFDNIIQKIAPRLLHNSDLITRLEINTLAKELNEFLIVNKSKM